VSLVIKKSRNKPGVVVAWCRRSGECDLTIAGGERESCANKSAKGFGTTETEEPLTGDKRRGR